MFTLEGPHIVMSRTDAQNGLDFPTLIFDSMQCNLVPRAMPVRGLGWHWLLGKLTTGTPKFRGFGSLSACTIDKR
jgi:hypothetical protein